MSKDHCQQRILIVDDNPTNLEVLTEALSTHDYQVSVALDGNSALEQIQYRHPAIILLDVMMNELDGFETCKRLKSDPKTNDIPVIFMTALTDAESKMKGFSLGAVDYITKPFNQDEVLARINLQLKLQQITNRLENQNRQLQQEIEQRKDVEAKLQESLREKEILLKEIHHRVKNNLQIVASLLNLQKRSIKDPKIIQLFEDSQNRIYSMAIIHERLYQSKQLNQINLGEYLQDLVNALIQSYNIDAKQIEVQLHADPIYINIETATPCGLIVNELVTNIIKYAFPDRRLGKVSIECRTTPDAKILLAVCDNGVGIPDRVDFNNPSSLGLRIITNLARQLRATLDLDRSNGTRLSLQFSEVADQNRI